jgi:hypothetical protein
LVFVARTPQCHSFNHPVKKIEMKFKLSVYDTP